jgi:diaminopimelate epimerase
MQFHFLKCQGAGNDFVLVDARNPDVPDITPDLAVHLCDRHTGVGADGVLIVLRDQDGTWRMRLRNADGSLAEMCGNGIRCVARYVAEVARAPENPLPIQTDAGLRPCTWEQGADGRFRVSVAMGLPEVAPADEQVEAQGTRVAFRRVSVGNPHAVALSQAPWEDARRLGAALEVDPTFPNRTNVEFAQPLGPGRARVVVHERGCGITQACGTGATAVGAAFQAWGLLPAGAPLAVELPGGTVQVHAEADGTFVLSGEAEFVFRGTYFLD